MFQNVPSPARWAAAINSNELTYFGERSDLREVNIIPVCEKSRSDCAEVAGQHRTCRGSLPKMGKRCWTVAQ